MYHLSHARALLVSATLASVTGACSSAPVVSSSQPSPALAAAHWQQYASPAVAGYDAARLDLARRYADSVRSGAVMVSVNGVALAAWGDVERKLELHSVRKSLVSALFGIAAARQQVNLDATLGELGITDRTPLTTLERGAHIRDLLAARSGVYLPSAYAGREQDDERPKRDSHAPGTFFFYNNWDFNALGVIYEQVAKQNLYEAFRDRVAQPIGMEDYTTTDGFVVFEPSGSVHPAHTFRLSTRDLARFGELYRKRGEWNGAQVVPADWVEASTRQITSLGNGDGYGMLWWTYAKGSLGAKYPALTQYGMFAARGTGGQFILVVPELQMVFVHRGDTDHGREIRGPDVWRIAELVAEARTGAPSQSPALASLHAEPFASQLLPRPKPTYLVLDSAQIAPMLGEYVSGQRLVATVSMFKGRPFILLVGQGEAELLALSPTEFRVMPVSGVEIRIARDAASGKMQLSATLNGRAMEGVRRE